MLLPPFLHVENIETIKGTGIILSTRQPLVFAKLHKYKTFDLDRFNAVKARFADYAFVQIPGYSIGLSYEGNLANTRLQSEIVHNTLKSMADWYLNEKILKNETKHFQHFKTGT